MCPLAPKRDKLRQDSDFLSKCSSGPPSASLLSSTKYTDNEVALNIFNRDHSQAFTTYLRREQCRRLSLSCKSPLEGTHPKCVLQSGQPTEIFNDSTTIQSFDCLKRSCFRSNFSQSHKLFSLHSFQSPSAAHFLRSTVPHPRTSTKLKARITFQLTFELQKA